MYEIDDRLLSQTRVDVAINNWIHKSFEVDFAGTARVSKPESKVLVEGAPSSPSQAVHVCFLFRNTDFVPHEPK